MLNAKLTATGRYSVRLLSFQLVSLFPFSPISSCYRSIVILFPHFYAILFRTNGETKKTGRIKPAWGGWRWSERERGAVGDGGKELQVSRPAASRWISNYSFRLLRDFHHKATSKRQYIYIYIPILKDVNRKNNFTPPSLSFADRNTDFLRVHRINIDRRRTTQKVLLLHC